MLGTQAKKLLEFSLSPFLSLPLSHVLTFILLCALGMMCASVHYRNLTLSTRLTQSCVMTVMRELKGENEIPRELKPNLNSKMDSHNF